MVREDFPLYHAIPTFNDPEELSLLETLWEKEKMLVTSIVSLFHNVFYLKTEIIIRATFILESANAFNLVNLICT